MSTDSHDSGASHGEHRAHEIVKKSSKLVDNSFPSEKKKSKTSEGKVKKKHKKCHKHGHHHCHKHKHKRHKSGESSSKSKSFEQKFAIRSPPHGSNFMKSDQDNESSEGSQEESDIQNTSDEEVS